MHFIETIDMMYLRGDPAAYDWMAQKANNSAWTSENMLKYFKKIERLIDPELLTSEYAELHGTDGLLEIQREIHPIIDKYFEALEELQHDIMLDTTSSTSCLGYARTLFGIGDGGRQSSALAYISPIKSRSNLNLALHTTATKIVIENQVAKGVQVTTSSGESIKVNANKEVIVSAGAINSAALLMLSGIGPKDHLDTLGIKLVADLPVGKNLQGHPNVVVGFQMEENTACAGPPNPHKFLVPTYHGYVALDPAQSSPDYLTINMVFGPDSKDALELCINVMHYSDDVCQKLYDGTKGRNTLFTKLSLMNPKSYGEVLLASCEPTASPLVSTGIFSDSCDLTLMGQALSHHTRLLDTTYFKSVNASLIDTGLCKDTATDEEFWECYAKALSGTMGYYIGTCAIGSVVDGNLNVMGVESLRVVGPSVMPTLVSGRENAPVLMIAELAADLIKAKWNTSCDD